MEKISLKDALSFGGLKNAEVLAGSDALDSVYIESVTTIEVTEQSLGDWVKENQLCITTMYAIRDDLSKQQNLVRILAEKRCAALVICHVGIWINTLDHDLIALCQELSLPLIKPDSDISFLEILNPLIYRLMSSQEKKHITYRDLGQDILNMIIQGEPLSTIIPKAIHFHHTAVTFLDSYCNCIFSNKDRTEVEKEKTYILKNFNQVFPRLLQKGFLETEIPDTLIYLVQTKNNVLGFLLLDSSRDSNQAELLQIAETLNTVCALVTGRPTRTSLIKEHYVQEYITDLLIWNFRTESEAIARGVDAGLHIEGKNRFILINLNNLRNGNLYTDQIRMDILPQLREQLAAVDPDIILHLYSDQIFLLACVQGEADALMARLADVIRLFTVHSISVSIGVSEPISYVQAIPAAYKEATQAALLGRRYFGENRAICYAEVYFFREVGRIKEQESAAEYSQRFLAPLADYDERHQSGLLDTLVMLLKYNGDIQTVSKQMHLHRNTLLYRKNKMIEILGYSPFEMPHHFNIMIALQIQDMF